MSSPSATVSALACRLVETGAELAAHHAVRHRVFVLDQRLFARSDRDGRDVLPETLHVVGVDGGSPRPPSNPRDARTA